MNSYFVIITSLLNTAKSSESQAVLSHIYREQISMSYLVVRYIYSMDSYFVIITSLLNTAKSSESQAVLSCNRICYFRKNLYILLLVVNFVYDMHFLLCNDYVIIKHCEKVCITKRAISHLSWTNFHELLSGRVYLCYDLSLKR